MPPVSRLSSLVKVVLWKVVVTSLLPSALVPSRCRRAVLRSFGVTFRGSAQIRHGFDLMTPALVVGHRVFVNRGVVIGNTAPVVLEDDVALAHDVLITTTHHRTGDPTARAGAPDARPVLVGSGSWVGARAVILPGVTIGPGCVIAAGAVVTADCGPHGLYGGVPARRLRDLPRHR